MGLDSIAVEKIQKADEKFRKAETRLSNELARIRRGLEADTLAPVQFSADAESEEEAEMEAEMRGGFFGRRKRAKDRRKVQKVQGKMLANELEFLESLSEIL